MDVIDLQQINIKVFVTEDSPISYQNFIKVFNKWMEEADHDDRGRACRRHALHPREYLLPARPRPEMGREE